MKGNIDMTRKYRVATLAPLVRQQYLQPETQNGIAVWGIYDTAEMYTIRTAKELAMVFGGQVAK
jgi:hypothetical protein